MTKTSRWPLKTCIWMTITLFFRYVCPSRTWFSYMDLSHHNRGIWQPSVMNSFIYDMGQLGFQVFYKTYRFACGYDFPLAMTKGFKPLLSLKLKYSVWIAFESLNLYMYSLHILVIQTQACCSLNIDYQRCLLAVGWKSANKQCS